MAHISLRAQVERFHHLPPLHVLLLEKCSVFGGRAADDLEAQLDDAFPHCRRLQHLRDLVVQTCYHFGGRAGGLPRRSVSCCATMRATISDGPPAAKPTMSRTGLPGYVWACASTQLNAASSATPTRS